MRPPPRRVLPCFRRRIRRRVRRAAVPVIVGAKQRQIQLLECGRPPSESPQRRAPSGLAHPFEIGFAALTDQVDRPYAAVRRRVDAAHTRQRGQPPRPVVVVVVADFEVHVHAHAVDVQPFGQFVHCAHGNDPPLADHVDAVGKRLRLRHGVRGQQDASPLVAKPCNKITHLERALRVQSGGRLVEQHQSRLRAQCARDVQALAHATREGLHPLIRLVEQVHALQRLMHARFDQAPRHACHPSEETKIVDRGGPRIEAAFAAEQQREVASGPERVANRVDAAHADLAAVGQQQRRGHLHRGRLACAVRPEQADDTPPLDSERQSPHDLTPMIPSTVRSGDVGHPQHGHVIRFSSIITHNSHDLRPKEEIESMW